MGCLDSGRVRATGRCRHWDRDVLGGTNARRWLEGVVELPGDHAGKPEGPKIPEKNRLEGTVSALRPGEMVWAFTASAEDRTQIYPLFGPYPVKDGEWACPYSFIGEEEGEPVDKKSKHVIWVAVITDSEAAGAVQALGKPSKPYIESAAQEPPHVEDAIDSEIFFGDWGCSRSGRSGRLQGAGTSGVEDGGRRVARDWSEAAPFSRCALGSHGGR